MKQDFKKKLKNLSQFGDAKEYTAVQMSHIEDWREENVISVEYRLANECVHQHGLAYDYAYKACSMKRKQEIEVVEDTG